VEDPIFQRQRRDTTTKNIGQLFLMRYLPLTAANSNFQRLTLKPKWP